MRKATENMKMKLNVESKYMMTKQQQKKYSTKYRILKKHFKDGLIKINDLTKQLDVEKKT